MKEERTAYLHAFAKRLVAQADVSTGKLVSVQALERAFEVAATIVIQAPDTIAGRAKKRGNPGRHALADLARNVYQWCAEANYIINDARREVAKELERARKERGGDDA